MRIQGGTGGREADVSRVVVSTDRYARHFRRLMHGTSQIHLLRMSTMPICRPSWFLSLFLPTLPHVPIYSALPTRRPACRASWLTVNIMHQDANIAARFFRNRSATRAFSRFTLSTFWAAASPVSSNTYKSAEDRKVKRPKAQNIEISVAMCASSP